MSDPSSWFDPHHRRIVEALSAGAVAASCSLYERDGELAFDTCTNNETFAIVRFLVPGETTIRRSRCSLSAIPLLAACGVEIRSVSSPDMQALCWTGAAVLDTRWKLPPPPEWVRRPPELGIWLVTCDDYQGLSALPLSGVKVQGRRFGDAVARVAAKTAIPNARARMDRARRALQGPGDHPSDDLRALVAEALADIFHSEAAAIGADGGLAMLQWEIARRDTTGEEWQTVAGSLPTERRPTTVPARRHRLFDEVLRITEAEVFGTGIHSPRSTREIVSLDQSVGESEDAPSLGARLAYELDLGSGLELDDLIQAADLTKREREVFELRRADLTQAEIAMQLGITTSTAGVHSRNVKKKLRRAHSAS